MNKEKVISLLDKLGIDTTGEFEDKRYILQIPNSDDYSKYYTILDHEDDFELSDASSMSQEFATVLTYINDEYKIRLNANFTDDYYTFTVEEL